MSTPHETLRQLMAEQQDKILLVELNNDVRFRSQAARSAERARNNGLKWSGAHRPRPSRNPVRVLMAVPAPYWFSPLTLYGTTPTHKRWVHLSHVYPNEVHECVLTDFDVPTEPILSRERRIFELLPIALTLEAGLIDGNERIIAGKKLIKKFSPERTKT